MNNLKVENSDKGENKRDLKIFLMCISLGAVGFGLIGILPYEIPLFLRVLIACILLGIPLLNFKKIVIFGISGGLGYFVKDYIFWDLADFEWLGTGVEVFSGVMIGTFLGVALWDRKAIKIFPLSGALAFFLSVFSPFAGSLGAGTVFGAGMYLYLSSLKKTRTKLRTIAILYFLAILLFLFFGFLMLLAFAFGGGHPPVYIGEKVSIGEVVERDDVLYQVKMRMAVTNYTFLPHDDTGRDIKVGIMMQNTGNASRYSKDINIYLWYKQDKYLGKEILVKRPAIRPEIPEPKTMAHDYLLFENLPAHLRTKEHAVVWEVWTERGIERIIWRLK